MSKENTSEETVNSALRNCVMWRFRAYESEVHCEKDDFFFERMFNDHTEMKVFSSNHSYNNRQKYPEYRSMYWRVENAT